jgi:hypothetical protein
VRAARAAVGADTGAKAARATGRPGTATAAAAIGATDRGAAILAVADRRIRPAAARARTTARTAISQRPGRDNRRDDRRQARRREKRGHHVASELPAIDAAHDPQTFASLGTAGLREAPVPRIGAQVKTPRVDRLALGQSRHESLGHAQPGLHAEHIEVPLQLSRAVSLAATGSLATARC